MYSRVLQSKHRGHGKSLIVIIEGRYSKLVSDREGVLCNSSWYRNVKKKVTDRTSHEG